MRDGLYIQLSSTRPSCDGRENVKQLYHGLRTITLTGSRVIILTVMIPFEGYRLKQNKNQMIIKEHTG